MNILLVCERSAGHIFPALAIAKALTKEGKDALTPKVHIFATAKALKPYVRKEGFNVVGRSFSKRNLIGESFWRFFEAIYLLLKLRPKKVIGFGGRDSFFIVLFSWLFFIETSIYEPNLKFGKANFLLSFFVKKVLRGFGDISENPKTKVIGVPLRSGLIKLDRIKVRQELGFGQEPVILCFGGSQGASFINSVFLDYLKGTKKDLAVIHLTGKEEYFQILQLYNKIKYRAFIRDFYYEMETLYSASDIVVSRAGALSLAEVSFFGLPSVLIPHPQGGAHQRENAFYLEKQGAAYVFPQPEFNFKEFSNSLDSLVSDQKLRNQFSSKMAKVKGGVRFEEFCRSFSL